MEVQSSRDGQQTSIWENINSRDKSHIYVENQKDIYDVSIIGGGITGITTALLLQKAGMSCIVLEARQIGFGTTGGTSAHLNTFFDATYPEIEQNFGAEAAKLVALAGKEALSIIENCIESYHIACDFEHKEAFLFSEDKKQTEQLREILAASKRVGLAVDEADNNQLTIPFDYCISFKNQAQFHPLKYLLSLSEAFTDAGGVLLEETPVSENSYKDNIHFSKTERGIVKSKHLVYATHIPPGISLLSFRCAPYRSYVVAAKLCEATYPHCLVYDMREPYHYFRTHRINGSPYLLIGGADHKTGHNDPQRALAELRHYAEKHFAIQSIDFAWSSQYYVPADGLPYIGQFPLGTANTYVATGFNGNGMIFGTLSAKIISDSILKKENPFADLFNPSRIKPVAGFHEFIKENADVVYHFLLDRFSAEEVKLLKEIQVGEGKVIDFQGRTLAVYKDINGTKLSISILTMAT